VIPAHIPAAWGCRLW